MNAALSEPQARAERLSGDRGLLLVSLKGARMAAMDILLTSKDEAEVVRATTTIAMLDAMVEAWGDAEAPACEWCGITEGVTRNSYGYLACADAYECGNRTHGKAKP